MWLWLQGVQGDYEGGSAIYSANAHCGQELRIVGLTGWRCERIRLFLLALWILLSSCSAYRIDDVLAGDY